MKRSLILLCLLLALATSVSAFYGADSKVVKLTSANFREKVLQGKGLWFVEFYAPWCGHCQRLTPEWEKLASALEGVINVGAVDMTTDEAAGSPYGIRGFPTIKFFGADKDRPEDFQGQRTVDAMVSFAFEQARKAVDTRARGGSSSGGSYNSNTGGNPGGSCGGGGFQQQQQQPGGSCGGGPGSNTGSTNSEDVIVLTDENFNDLMSSEELWIVDFYAPWCGHCKNLEPEWNKAATNLKGEVKVAKVDATAQPSLASRFGVNAYPQIKLFPSGPKSDGLVEDYEGNRDSGSITNWALEKKAQYKPASKVVQLVDQETFDNYCANIRGICFIAFLPHIYDSSANERNDYIEVLQELSNENRVNPVTFSWSQGGDYYGVEESLGLGSGYPAFVAMSVNKMKYATLTGSYNKKNLDLFIKSLISGKQPLFNLREVPKFKTVSKWDGNDQKQASESVDL